MSIKINKNGKEYDLGFVPQSLYDDVKDLKEANNNRKLDFAVDIRAYTSSNKYTIPDDGYIYISYEDAFIEKEFYF